MPTPTIGPRTLMWLKRPPVPPPYQRTDDDVDILKELARNRFMSTEQIARAVGRSPRAVRARLYRMWADKLIERPEQQAPHRSSFAYNGPRPLIYALARKGARFLQAREVALEHRLDWTFRQTTTPALLHTLKTADVMIEVHRAAAAHGALAVIDHHELLADFPEATRRAKRPFSLAVTITERGKSLRLTNVPDRLFSLVANEERVNFALELDTGSETIDPQRITKTKATIRRKHTVYRHAFLRGAFREQWGFERLRVLFVTTSEKRIANMIAAQEKVTEGHAANMFLYTTLPRLSAHGIFGPAWKTSESDGVSLLPPSFSVTEASDARA